MLPVSSEQILDYLPLIKKLARKYTGLWKAEWDDLCQEGMIAVWLAMAAGYRPTPKFIQNRMKNWVKKCREGGFTEY